jgi:hypothetical protein
MDDADRKQNATGHVTMDVDHDADHAFASAIVRINELWWPQAFLSAFLTPTIYRADRTVRPGAAVLAVE